jgi:hypothetical protein
MNHTGKIGEALWANYLESRGWSVTPAPNGRFYDWDIKANNPNKELTFEIKYDSKAYFWAEKRGKPEDPNLYIEFENTKKAEPSGIRRSIADYYVYIIKNGDIDRAYIYNRETLCSFCESGGFKVVGNSGFGDDNASGWIPPLKKTMTLEAGYVASIELKLVDVAIQDSLENAGDSNKE